MPQVNVIVGHIALEIPPIMPNTVPCYLRICHALGVTHLQEGKQDGGASSSSGVVVQVREKKGPLRAAIPYMPFPVAVICLFLNTFVPGLGTFVSAFTVLCGARTDLPDRHVCCVFWLNIAAALIQILTAIVMVGWIMSIFWGMDMVILAILTGYKEQGIPQQL
ncbi:hypothetical protein H8957_000022 [Semnopithecus entellus]